MRSTAAKVLYGGAHGLHFITAQLHLSGTSVAAERLHAIGAPLCTAVTQDSSQRQEYSTTSCSSAIAADYVSHTQQLAITACQNVPYQQQHHRCFSSSPHDTSTPKVPSTSGKASPESSEEAQRVVLYRGRGMVPFRVLVRLKIFQLGGVAALAIPINTFLVEGSVSSIQMVMASALVLGCATASVTLWYFSRRYVGELSLLRGGPPGRPSRLCFSVLDFWGNREDTAVELDRLIPPFKGASDMELGFLAGQTLLPIDVEGDRQFFLSIPHGRIMRKDLLLQALKGELDDRTI